MDESFMVTSLCQNCIVSLAWEDSHRRHGGRRLFDRGLHGWESRCVATADFLSCRCSVPGSHVVFSEFYPCNPWSILLVYSPSVGSVSLWLISLGEACSGSPLPLALFPRGEGTDVFGCLRFATKPRKNRAQNEHSRLPMERSTGFTRLKAVAESWLEAANQGELMGFDHRF